MAGILDGLELDDPAYLVPRAEEALRAADIVVGFETVVDFVRDRTDADLLTCGYRDEATALATFAERVAGGERGTAVLMGDPNHSGYQFVGKVERAVDEAVGAGIFWCYRDPSTGCRGISQRICLSTVGGRAIPH